MTPAIWTPGYPEGEWTPAEKKRFWGSVRAAVRGFGRAFASRKFGLSAVERVISTDRKRPAYMGVQVQNGSTASTHRRLARKLRPECVEEAQRRAADRAVAP